MNTLLTGGTGFVGRELIKRMKNVSITSRDQQRAEKNFGSQVDEVIHWRTADEPLLLPKNHSFQSVVNLMGDPIAEGRWTKDKKKRIRDSRVLGTRKLVDALLQAGQLPEVLVSASAIGIYGDAGDDLCEEDHPHGQCFLTDVCAQWENEAMQLQTHGVRVVCLRIGIVLGADGGALKEMTPLFRRCMGGRLGNGKQWMSWIHVSDLASLIQWSIQNQSISGPVNATAPNPARNEEFTKILASAVGRPAFLSVPKFALRLVLGEFAESLLYSQRVVPAVALANGFQFEFTDLANAIKDTVV